MKLSIIIPFYNAENYLQKCLESVITNCPEKEVEIILVNDGSTDSGKQIAERLIQEDRRFVLVNQINSGVSAARNRGIVQATGEYITFVDADDLLSNDYYSYVLPMLEMGTDLVLYSHYQETEDHRYIEKKLPIAHGQQQVDCKILKLPLTWASNAVWDKIFKRSLIVNNDIKFPYGMKTSEDLMFFMKSMEYIKNYVYINKPLYYYRYVVTGAVRKFLPQYVQDLQIVYQEGMKYIERMLDESYIEEFSKIILWQYVGLVSNCDNSNFKDLKHNIYQSDNTIIYDLTNSKPCSVIQIVYQKLFKIHSLFGIRMVYRLTQIIRKREKKNG